VSGAAEWLWLDRVSYKPAFPRLPVSGRSVGSFYVSSTGLGVSPGGFFQSDERLIVVFTEFYDSYWTRIFDIQDKDSFYRSTWHQDDDVLRSVLSEVQKR